MQEIGAVEMRTKTANPVYLELQTKEQNVPTRG